uniref:Uncharacterized protein n=1 Tax=Globodera pallida TaxID=36090 RepID=A0A183BPD8_GLOPA
MDKSSATPGQTTGDENMETDNAQTGQQDTVPAQTADESARAETLSTLVLIEERLRALISPHEHQEQQEQHAQAALEERAKELGAELMVLVKMTVDTTLANERAAMNTTLANERAAMNTTLANERAAMNAAMNTALANERAAMNAAMNTALANERTAMNAAFANEMAAMNTAFANERAAVQAQIERMRREWAMAWAFAIYWFQASQMNREP